LPNALALNAMLFNSGRFLAPPLAGFLLAVSSEGTCFALNAISFLALIAGIRKFDFAPAARSKASLGDVFREGLRYAMQTHSVRTLLITLVITNLTASSYAVLLPLFAKEILGGDSVTLGWLWGAAGCGAFLSTIFLASHRSSGGIAIVIASGTLLCAGALFGLAFSGQFVTSILTMVVLGFGISVTNVGCNIVLQAMAPDTMRGRVISFFTSVRFGFDALGGLIAGAIAAQLGVPPTLLVEAVIQLCGAFWLASHLRALRSGIVNPPPLTVARGS
jgi:predicted MFS family arabinose efflux permease